MKAVSTSDAPKAVGPYSQAIVSGNFVFCAGQVGLDPQSGNLISNDLEEQTIQALNNIKAVLEAANTSLKHVVKTTCYLKNISDFQSFNAVYASFFIENKPARATVEVSNLPKGALVEIEAIAEV